MPPNRPDGPWYSPLTAAGLVAATSSGSAPSATSIFGNSARQSSSRRRGRSRPRSRPAARLVRVEPGCAATLSNDHRSAAAIRASCSVRIRSASFDAPYAPNGEYLRSDCRSS
ncbi:MAG TPA: hypothetical protein VGC45_08635, partial [Gryllotalpicola sp.]